MSFYKEVWQKLTDIDVSDKIEKKQNLNYLSWSWAWGTLMEVYPESVYEFLENTEHHDGTLTVNIKVTIKDGDKLAVRFMWLPVINYKNQAIPKPDAMQINTAKMRCLTKCLAMFGLGHYIYAGEDVPSEKYDTVQPVPINEKQLSNLTDLYESLEFDDETKVNFWNWMSRTYKVIKFDSLSSKNYDDVLKALRKKEEDKQNVK